MTGWRERVVRAFDAAADYDVHAGVQQVIADWLAGRIVASGPHARVLEIGCGTGFLAEAALTGSGAQDWLMTDIAPAMVARAQARFGGRAGVRFAMLDGERPGPADGERFDLVCSSLAAQWFADLPGALDRLARRTTPGGALMLTTLAAGTFGEWRDALGGAAGTPDYPDADALAALRPDGLIPAIEIRRIEQPYPDAMSFLRSLRALGAATPRIDHRPLSPTALRAAARAFDAAGGIATYEVALLSIRRLDDAA